jgi:hypothetical protein
MSSKKDDTVVLFRPVGQKELNLIENSGFKRFPARLFHQPFFYPVLNRAYAEQIARDWNTKDAASDYVGYVTRFRVKRAFISNYEVKTVGQRSRHEEYWIPSEDLEQMNHNLMGTIEVIAEFRSFPETSRTSL